MPESPAFQFYPAEYLSDENVAMMSLEEEGAYLRLMCYCWRQGTIPNDPVKLARLCKTTPAKMEEMWPAVSVCFRSTKDDRLAHPRLDVERTKQAGYKRKMSEAGKRGAEARKAKGGYGQAKARLSREVMASDGSLSSSLSSTVNPTDDESSGASSDVDNSESEKLRGEFAQLVRKHLWQSKDPPSKGWTMGREYSIRKAMIAQKQDPQIINGVIAMYRGDKCTMKVYWAKNSRPRWEIDKGAYLKAQPVTVRQALNSAAEILNEMGTPLRP